MGNTVAKIGALAPRWRSADVSSLYGSNGRRKYLNASERQRVMAAIDNLREDRRLFALTLAWTGARPSEVLALVPASFQLDVSIVAIRTLKRRRLAMREIPIPSDLMREIETYFDVAQRQSDPVLCTQRLWPWNRVTAWRIIKGVMQASGITGVQACPRGFRHGFGVGTLQAGVPLNLTQQWLGHARLTTTAIYAAACGPEEIGFAQRFWKASRGPLAPKRASVTGDP